MITAAIYARKSTDQGSVADEAKSVTRQVGHARQYAATKGWTVADECVFVDDGISGAEFARRRGPTTDREMATGIVPCATCAYPYRAARARHVASA